MIRAHAAGHGDGRRGADGQTRDVARRPDSHPRELLAIIASSWKIKLFSLENEQCRLTPCDGARVCVCACVYIVQRGEEREKEQKKKSTPQERKKRV